jgi:hypothetical protein
MKKKKTLVGSCSQIKNPEALENEEKSSLDFSHPHSTRMTTAKSNGDGYFANIKHQKVFRAIK